MTTRAFTGSEVGYNRPVSVERSDPTRKTEADIPIPTPNTWELSCQREKQRVEKLRLERIEQRRQEQLRAQAEQDKINRRQLAESADFQIMAIFDQYGLSDSERVAVEDTITRRGLWATPMTAVEFAMVEVLRISADREASLAKIQATCDPDEWQEVVSIVEQHRHQFTDKEVADGTAHREVLKRMYQ